MNVIYLEIKLIKLNPETQKAFEPPCNIMPQVCFDLNQYLTSWMRSEDQNVSAYNKAVTEILEKVHATFQTPLGWQIRLQNIEIDFLNPPEWREDRLNKELVSKEFAYSPEYDQKTINLEFVWKWITENKLY